jgi:F-type H+-transporting ATPase subunit epsilon
VEIVTQEGRLFLEPEADMVVLPGADGQMGIMPHHAALLTTLAFGELIVRKGNAEESFIVYGGVVEVRPDSVNVLADTAESSYELDEAKAQQARERAEQVMREGLPPDKSAAVLQELRRATLQENVLSKVKSRAGQVRIRVQEAPENGGKKA